MDAKQPKRINLRGSTIIVILFCSMETYKRLDDIERNSVKDTAAFNTSKLRIG